MECKKGLVDKCATCDCYNECAEIGAKELLEVLKEISSDTKEQPYNEQLNSSNTKISDSLTDETTNLNNLNGLR